MEAEMDSFLTKMKCAFCGSEKYSSDDRRTSKDIDKQLARWQKEDERIIKCLLLGIGESGKSTLTKQMRIIHVGAYTDTERMAMLPNILLNIKEAIQIILGAMTNINVPLDNSELAPSVEYIKSEEVIKSEFKLTQEFYDHVSRLWGDKGVQDCYKRSNEYQLFDSAKYFLDRVHIIREDNYIPNDQDLLRCRIMTNTIQRIDFKTMADKSTVSFSVYDVGGQQGERRKWIQVFDMVTAILFVIDCSCFDLTLREATSHSRFIETMETFEQVWNNRFLRQTPVVLFLNKIDLLEEKINQGRTLDNLIDTLDPSHHYHDLLITFRTFDKSKGDKIKDGERRQFIESFPRSDPATSPSSPLLTPSKTDQSKQKGRGGKKKSSIPAVFRDDIHEEVVRTGVFIKRIFMHLVHNPILMSDRGQQHNGHNCEFFYTCAVDTQTIRKVLEGCRTLIIRKVLDKWGM